MIKEIYPLFGISNDITYIDELCLALQKIINDKLTGIFMLLLEI